MSVMDVHWSSKRYLEDEMWWEAHLIFISESEVAWVWGNLPTANFRPPFKPDLNLNPLDYAIYTPLGHSINSASLFSVGQLKKTLSLEWDNISKNSILDSRNTFLWLIRGAAILKLLKIHKIPENSLHGIFFVK